MNTYATIVLAALVLEWLLHLVADLLNLRALSPELPKEFEDVYDAETYAKSQEYTRARTRFGLIPATFDWTTLLLSTEADVDLSVPAALVEAAGQGNPQLAMAIGSGFLVKEGDAYIMKAKLKKGLATVNGAPIPIPLGGM